MSMFEGHAEVFTGPGQDSELTEGLWFVACSEGGALLCHLNALLVAGWQDQIEANAGPLKPGKGPSSCRVPPVFSFVKKSISVASCVRMSGFRTKIS